MKTRAFGALSLLALLLIAMPASSSDGIYGDVDGAPGETITAGFSGQIEVLAVSFGYRVTSSSTTSRAVPAPITITKVVDKSTPQLMKFGALGNIIPTVLFSSVRATNDGTNTVYMEVELVDAVITDWSMNDTSGGEQAIEQVSFRASAVNVTYYPIDANGRRGAPISSKITFGSTTTK